MSEQSSLQKALNLLEAVAETGRIGLRALAQKNGLPPATAHRLAGQLVRRGYLAQDPASREYRLSFKVLELGARFKESLDIIALARPAMKELMEATGETVNLVAFDGAEVVYVEQVANPQSLLRMFTRVGARAPLYCSGVGKAFLAARPEDEALALFRRMKKKSFTPRTIVDEAAMRAELNAIRQQGYAVDNEEMEPGVRCVAAQVRQGEAVVAALSVSGPSSRIGPDQVSRLGVLVREAAGLLSAQLGRFQRI